MPRGAFRLPAERSSPIQQKRARDAVPPRRRRDRPWRLHAFHNDLELLVIRPASTSAGFDNSQPFNLSTVLIAVHKDCYRAIKQTRQGGLHRRKTALHARRSLIPNSSRRWTTAFRFPAGVTTSFPRGPSALRCPAWHRPAAASAACSRPPASSAAWPRRRPSR